jgi:hypothetical protein
LGRRRKGRAGPLGGRRPYRTPGTLGLRCRRCHGRRDIGAATGAWERRRHGRTARWRHKGVPTTGRPLLGRRPLLRSRRGRRRDRTADRRRRGWRKEITATGRPLCWRRPLLLRRRGHDGIAAGH